MEYLDGMDLETLVERFGPLPAPRVVYLLQQAAESLAEAHHSGLVHRDIKPSNIYLTQLGVRSDFVKVLDFGLVKSQSQTSNGQTKLTMEGTTTGTPAFMAPELALGKNQIDPRADIYALGCVAYWLLTGLFVFEGETPMEIVVSHVKTPPLPPSKRTELEIPSSLEKVVMACLSKEPGDRPQTMEELSRMLFHCQLESPWTQEEAARWWQSHLRQQSTD
jgi:serine/threonine-protein kinase